MRLFDATSTAVPGFKSVLVTLCGCLGFSMASATPASFLGANCGATAKQLERLGSSIVVNDDANRDLLGVGLDPVFSVSAISVGDLETMLASRLPIFPAEYKAAELLFKAGRLLRMTVHFKATEDTSKATNALALMQRINGELLSKYSMLKRMERVETGPLAVSFRDDWIYEGTAGKIRIGYVFRETQPLPQTQVLVRVDFSEKCPDL